MPMIGVLDPNHPELGGNFRYGENLSFMPVLWKPWSTDLASARFWMSGVAKGRAYATSMT
jgi:hypothetical protein